MPQDPLRLLVVEPSFPGRLGPLVDWLVRRRGYRATFFCHAVEDPHTWPPSVGRGLDVIKFEVGGVAREPAVDWRRDLERGLCYAFGAWEVYDARRVRPVDLILGHSAGLGSTLFAPVTYPGTAIVSLFDGYRHARRHDLADEDSAKLPPSYIHWRRASNAMDLLDLENGIHPWTLTRWQANLYPPEYRGDFHVAFDGVDQSPISGEPDGPLTLAGRTIPPEVKVVTFAADPPDRLRGLDRFLALAERLIAERSDVLCLVIGAGPVRRMLDVDHHGRDYLAETLAARPLSEHDRLWCPGRLPHAEVLRLLRRSDLHVDPSRVHAVGRPLIEAMGLGTLVLAWDSVPVREFIEPGRTGLLAPADDTEASARIALKILDDPAAHRPIGLAAAEVAAENWSREAAAPRLAEFFSKAAG